ncbi:MAG: hypothetical protein Ct9H300mP16_01460 [Pseudomonadota bacterium]|nr:MAG: hypothetical protein Ct9H300mP16_01460 [Pseudomonadota bacterium]
MARKPNSNHSIPKLAGNVRDGTLDVNIEATYDITEIKDALNHAGQEGRNGKISWYSPTVHPENSSRRTQRCGL